MIKGVIRWFFRGLCGIIILCWALQFHPKIQHRLRHALISLAEAEWHARITCDSCSINCLTGSISFDGARIVDTTRPETWWSCKKCSISSSLFDLLTTASLGIYIDLSELSGHSTTNEKGLTLKQHFEQIITTTSSLPIQTQRVTIENISASLTHSSNTYTMQTKMGLACLFDPGTRIWEGKVFAHKGELFCNDLKWAHDISYTGTWAFESDTDAYTWHGNYVGHLTTFPLFCQHVRGVLAGNTNHITGITEIPHFAHASWLFNNQKLYGTATSTIATLAGLVTTTAHVFFDIEQFTGSLEAQTTLENLATGGAHVTIAPDEISGSFDLTHQGFHASKTRWCGTIHYDMIDDKGLFTGKNQTVFQWPEKAMLSKPSMIEWNGSFDRSLSMTSSLDFRWIDRIFDRTDRAQGNLIMNTKAMDFSLKKGKSLLATHGCFDAPLFNISGSYCYGKQQIAQLHTNPTKATGTIICDLASLNKLNEQISLCTPLQLQGNLFCSFEQTMNNYFTFSWQVQDCLMRAQDYTITITAAHGSGSYNHLMRQISSTDITLNTPHGSITIPYATCLFDPLFKPLFAHGSLLLHALHVQWHQEMRGQIDAIIRGHYKTPELPMIEGQIFIKDGVIKQCSALEDVPEEKLCSAYLPGSTHQQGVELNLLFKTENPIIFATAALSTHATALLHLATRYTHGHFHNPRLTGNILCKQGSISFLKHTLSMTRGQAEFLPHRPYDPQIEFIAHTRIKQYLISLYISGTAGKPHISFSSVPHLSQEQILALLIAGSDTATMYHDLPTVILQNLHGIFAGEHKHAQRTTSLLKALTKPLEYIQITPQFSNQTGRGGIKATLSIDVNPQLHAHMQKDFSLQEDLAIDVEYFLSDDINIRIAKDARGDVGAEAEVRCKFS